MHWHTCLKSLLCFAFVCRRRSFGERDGIVHHGKPRCTMQTSISQWHRIPGIRPQFYHGAQVAQFGRVVAVDINFLSSWFPIDQVLHPGGIPGANLKSTSHRCHPILVAFVWELTSETIDLPLGCLQGGAVWESGCRRHQPSHFVVPHRPGSTGVPRS